ncbi:MAG: hypothetical protein AAF441_14085 [Pseudomonadota bacterium]
MLSHSAAHVAGLSDGSHVIAASENGTVTVCETGEGGSLKEFGTGQRINALSVHPFASLLAIMDGDMGTLKVIDFAGNVAAVHEHSGYPRSDVSWLQAGRVGCLFESTGTQLWAAHTDEEGSIAIEVRQTDGWLCTVAAKLSDPFGESSCTLHGTPDPGRLLLWVAAGQDGQVFYELEQRGAEICITQLPETLANTGPPAFSPDGSAALFPDGEGELLLARFPGWDIADAFDEETTGIDFGLYAGFLDSGHILASSHDDGRFWVFSLSRPAECREIILEGHEPQPTSHYYPSLPDEGLVSDIYGFQRVGEAFVFLTHNLAQEDTAGAHEISIYAAETILRCLAAPQD